MSCEVAELPWSVERAGRNVFTVRVPYQRKVGWEQWFLLSGDRHWDNPKSLWDLQRRHLDEAVEFGAGIVDVGDLFCAMQGKWDKRACKSDLRPEHQDAHYLDSLVTTAADFFAPYAQNFVCIGKGNHETGVLKRHETDLTERLCATLTDRTGAPVYSGQYGGWVRFMFESEDKSKVRSSINLKYNHGYGGGGAVTKGVIQTNRRAVFLPDADIVLTGHVHEAWLLEISRERLSAHGRVYHDTQTHVCTGTYKEEYGDGGSGWHVETGKPPKPLGAWWLRFFYDRRNEVSYELTRAK